MGRDEYCTSKGLQASKLQRVWLSSCTLLAGAILFNSVQAALTPHRLAGPIGISLSSHQRQKLRVSAHILELTPACMCHTELPVLCLSHRATALPCLTPSS